MKYTLFLGFGFFLLLIMLNKFLFHEKIVFDSFEFELSESALGDRGDWR